MLEFCRDKVYDIDVLHAYAVVKCVHVYRGSWNRKKKLVTDRLLPREVLFCAEEIHVFKT